jgi:DNA primase
MSTDRLAGHKTLAVEGILEELEKDEIKRQVDIVELFASFGVKLIAKGKGFIGRCPWHDDKEPSLSVDREKGLYHCFGCGESGDAVSLVEKMKGVGFREAVEYLKSRAGKLPAAERRMDRASAAGGEPAEKSDRASSAGGEPAEKSSAGDLTHILDEVAARYASELAAHPEARSYLASRGLDLPDLITGFKVGYCAGGLSGSLGAAQKAELVRLGVLKASGAEHFASCITFPLFDAEGRVAGFYGRRILSNSGPAHLYLPGAHRGLFNREAARVYPEELLLTESVIDALSLIALGIPNALPCYGVGGFTSEHAALLRDERVKCVAIGFDSDEPGRKAAEKLAERLQEAGLSVKLIAPPRVKDWNEYLVSGGKGDELKALIASTPIRAAAPEARTERPLELAGEGERKVFALGEVRYKLAGLKELFVANLRVNIRAEASGKSYIDNVDLYSARSRSAFSANFASLSGLESPRVERDLVAILDHLEAERDKRLSAGARDKDRTLSEEERSAGMAMLTDPHLVENILADLDALGYVGEEENKLLVYLAATSRGMEDPLSVLLVSESASGKSFLIECVKRLMPPEEVVAMTSLSDQALQYLPEDALLHKFLVMGEAVHSLAVEHQVREMLSSRELSRLVTLKDEKTGELSSRMVRKQVLVSCALSTTNPQVNPENASRFFVVGADESVAQTRAIHRRQREKYSLDHRRQGEKESSAIEARHRAAQRLLSPRVIVNPFAAFLEFPSRLMRSRRDHERFLDLIACVCHLRQYLKTERENGGVRYIECDLTDYAAAHGVMSRVLSSTYGELPQGALELYEALRGLAKKKAAEQGVGADEIGVSQRELREATGLVAHSVKRSLRLLVDYEYLVVEGSRRRGSRVGYRLIRDESACHIGENRIPSPEEVALKLQSLQSGTSGTDRDKSGTVPLLGT